MRRLKKEKGAALVTAYLVVAVLITMGLGFTSAAVTELNQARYYVDSVKSFWLAEAGIADAVRNLKINQSWGPTNPTVLTSGTYSIQLNSTPSALTITSTGTSSNIHRNVEIQMPYIPACLANTISSGGNMLLSGLGAQTEVYGKTRLSGTFSRSGIGASAYFEDKQEHVNQNITKMTYPDSDNNGTPDQFNDFKTFNQAVLTTYSPSEVVYIQTDSTVNIFPNRSLAGKKIIYVEGSTPGAGDVNIFFDASWRNGEDLTVISTGTIDYVEPLQFQTDARLSTIAWDEYHEYTAFLSTHEGITYAHDETRYYDILDYSVSTGNIIANVGVNEVEVISLKRFYYSPDAMNGDLPPGFRGLVGGTSVLSTNPTNWKEVN